jgi:choline transporter-like protein 2/4/5
MFLGKTANFRENEGMEKFVFLFNIFEFYWLIQFLRAFNEMVLAGVFANWYWTFNKREIGFWSLGISFCRTLR